MKCTNCVCAIKTPEGIWCVRFKETTTRELAEKCRYYVDRRCLGGLDGKK